MVIFREVIYIILQRFPLSNPPQEEEGSYAWKDGSCHHDGEWLLAHQAAAVFPQGTFGIIAPPQLSRTTITDFPFILLLLSLEC